MRIFDPVHGFIELAPEEVPVIDSRPFQRLRYIHQIGLTHLVYPGATHKRFEHSLGVMHLASKMFDRATEPRFLLKSLKGEIPPLEDPQVRTYWRQLLRLAALCHDMGHLPFSHVAEAELLPTGGHEGVTRQIILSEEMRAIWETFPKLNGRDFSRDLMRISLGPHALKEIGEDAQISPWEGVMSSFLTGDFFGADRMDYLLRDARYTGVSYGIIDDEHLLRSIRILPFQEGMALGICESALQAVEGLLLARYFMHSRVYQHPKARSYGFSLQRFMKEYYPLETFSSSLETFLQISDNEVLVALYSAAYDEGMAGHKHAKKIVFREHRVACIPVQVNGGKMGAELEKMARGLSERLSGDFAYDSRAIAALKEIKEEEDFPCLRNNEEVLPSRRCSQILNRVGNVHSPVYLYVSKEKQAQVQGEIDNLKIKFDGG